MLKGFINYMKDVVNENEMVYIMGHDNADLDSYLSGIWMEKILRTFKIKAKFVTLDNYCEATTTRLLSTLGYHYSDYGIPHINKTDKVILVDCSTSQYSDNVLAIVDHHISSVECGYVARELCGSNLLNIFYNFIGDMSYLDKQEILELVYATFNDTICLLSTKCTERDKNFLLNIIKDNSFDYDVIFNDCLGFTDMSQSLDIISMNGYKIRKSSLGEYSTSYIIVDTIDTELNIRICKHIQKTLRNFLRVFTVSDTTIGITLVYLISRHNIRVSRINSVISLGNDIVPIIEEYADRCELVEFLENKNARNTI